jgi:hypothetical protein
MALAVTKDYTMRLRFSNLFLTSLSIFIFAISVSSCTVLEVGIERTPTPNLVLTAFSGTLEAENVLLATRIANVSSQFTITQTPLNSRPTLTPSPTLPPPAFSSLRFAPQPDDSLARDFYVAGIPQIFALWDYSGMREGMLIKRVWKRNDVVWIEREEPWAFSRYGRQGTVRDIYIFDDEVGIESGSYSLSLYIDGVLQDLSSTNGTQSEKVIHVFESDVAVPVTSPDKSHTAFVQFGGQLLMEEPDGRVWEIAQAQEIASLAWFPDGRYLLYNERDRSNQIQPDEDTGITHRMYLVDLDTGEQTILGTSGENFHSPMISPDGVFISVLSGNTQRDGCIGSPNLAFIELDTELRRHSIHSLSDFSGLEFYNNNSLSVIPRLSGERNWESDTKFSVVLEWVCKPPGKELDGLYVLDLSQMTAEVKSQP